MLVVVKYLLLVLKLILLILFWDIFNIYKFFLKVFFNKFYIFIVLLLLVVVKYLLLGWKMRLLIDFCFVCYFVIFLFFRF